MAHAPDPAVQAIAALTEALGNLQRQDAIKIPLFSGKEGENPAAHLLKLNDYCNTNNKDLHADHIFRDSLQGKARQWFEERDQNWNNAQILLEFKKEFDVYKGSKKLLMKRWYSLTFDPSNIKITDFVREVKSLGDVLEFNDAQKLAALQTMIPKESGWLINNANDFRTACQLLRKHYEEEEQKLDKVSQSGATAGSNPFNMMDGQLKSALKAVKFEKERELDTHESLNMIVDNLRDVIDKQQRTILDQHLLMSNDRNRSKSPYKPHTSFRGRGRGRPNYGFQDRNFSNRNRNFRSNSRGRFRGSFRRNNSFRGRSSFRNNFRGRSQSADRFRSQSRDRFRSQDRNRFRSQSRDRGYSNRPRFDKSPSRTGQPSKRFNKDSQRCFFCQEIGHWAQECPQRQQRGRSQSRDRNQQVRFSNNRNDRSQQFRDRSQSSDRLRQRTDFRNQSSDRNQDRNRRPRRLETDSNEMNQMDDMIQQLSSQFEDCMRTSSSNDSQNRSESDFEEDSDADYDTLNN